MSEQAYARTNFKKVIWQEILADPDVTLSELQAALQRANIPLSDQTTGSLAAEFRQILTFLIHEGLVNCKRNSAPTL